MERFAKMAERKPEELDAWIRELQSMRQPPGKSDDEGRSG
jgi:hypothetical protein